MKWCVCPDGSFFNIEKALDIRINLDKTNQDLFHLRAFFPLILTAEKGSVADSIIIISGNLETCEKTRNEIKEKLAAQSYVL